jgi:hypothetical protein
MTKTQVEVITSVQRRRRWSRAEKERIVAAAMEPGAVASDEWGGCYISRKIGFMARSRCWPHGVPGFLLSLPLSGEGKILQVHCRKLLRRPG